MPISSSRRWLIPYGRVSIDLYEPVSCDTIPSFSKWLHGIDLYDVKQGRVTTTFGSEVLCHRRSFVVPIVIVIYGHMNSIEMCHINYFPLSKRHASDSSEDGAEMFCINSV